MLNADGSAGQSCPPQELSWGLPGRHFAQHRLDRVRPGRPVLRVAEPPGLGRSRRLLAPAPRSNRALCVRSLPARKCRRSRRPARQPAPP